MGSNDAKTSYGTFDRPVLYCDENLTIVDMNDAADTKGFQRYRFRSMTDYISPRDRSNLTADIHLRKLSAGENEYISVVQIEHMRGAKYAFVTTQMLMGNCYLRFHIFQSSAEMFRNFDVSKMMLSETPFSPMYKLSRNRVDMEMTAENINRVMVSNFLINTYYTAVDSGEAPVQLDIVEIVRRMILDVAKRLELNPAYFSFDYDERGSFAYPVIGVSSFINVLTLLIILTGRLSADKKVKVSVDSDRKRVSILFRTTLKKSDTDFLGGFSFRSLALMFPEYSAFVSVIKFISELYGLRCYASLEGKRKLTVELVLAEAPPDVEIHCMHNKDDGSLDRMTADALSLADMIEKSSGRDL